MTDELKSRSRGVTLVELLVVIGLIAILLGFSLGALARVREQVDATRCADQLRQIGMASTAYAGQYRGWLYDPADGMVISPPGYSWEEKFFGAAYRQICVCPTGEDVEDRSYLMNGWIAGRGWARMGRSVPGRSPSDVVLAGEKKGSVVDLNVYIPNFKLYAFTDIVNERRHRRQTSNHLWLDFHVSNDAPKATPRARDPWDPR